MRILLVEDEQKLAAATAQVLKEHQYSVDVAHHGHEGLDLALMDCYDLLILDVMLPGCSGLTIVQEVRGAGLSTPTLLLTARDTVEDRVTGLDSGADDYLVKPYNTQELLARVRALSRRTGQVTGVQVLQTGPFAIHMDERAIYQNNTPLDLTNTEFQLLELLIRNRGKVMSKELILDRVWGPDADVVANAVENYIHFLRKKIDVAGEPSFIRTVRGVGYTFRTTHDSLGKGV